jgi:hypothetical protein
MDSALVYEDQIVDAGLFIPWIGEHHLGVGGIGVIIALVTA